MASYSLDVPRITTHALPTTPVPTHCTSNYHIMSLVDIGRSVHTVHVLCLEVILKKKKNFFKLQV